MCARALLKIDVYPTITSFNVLSYKFFIAISSYKAS